MTCPNCNAARMVLDRFGDDDSLAKFYCPECGIVEYREVKPDPPAPTVFSPPRPFIPECLG